MNCDDDDEDDTLSDCGDSEDNVDDETEDVVPLVTAEVLEDTPRTEIKEEDDDDDDDEDEGDKVLPSTEDEVFTVSSGSSSDIAWDIDCRVTSREDIAVEDTRPEISVEDGVVVSGWNDMDDCEVCRVNDDNGNREVTKSDGSDIKEFREEVTEEKEKAGAEIVRDELISTAEVSRLKIENIMGVCAGSAFPLRH